MYALVLMMGSATVAAPPPQLAGAPPVQAYSCNGSAAFAAQQFAPAATGCSGGLSAAAAGCSGSAAFAQGAQIRYFTVQQFEASAGCSGSAAAETGGLFRRRGRIFPLFRGRASGCNGG